MQHHPVHVIRKFSGFPFKRVIFPPPQMMRFASVLNVTVLLHFPVFSFWPQILKSVWEKLPAKSLL